MNKLALIATGALLAGALLTGGCSQDPTAGYTLNSQFPDDVKTVHVPIWHRGKNIYRRGLEFRLTEALIKRIELDTPYKVTDRDRAHTELTGTIDLIPQRVLSNNPDTGQPREKEVTLVVSFAWTDLRTGRDRARRQNVRQAGTYIPPEPLSEDFFQGSEDVINRLAQRIVEQMAAEW
ncbi:MAG TPA: LptE family protein [Phycisphaerae bacterium]|nr:LptE family protein [Phycisphaerae bacterium]